MLYNKTHDDKTYRVFLNKETNTIEVICIGMYCVDTQIEGIYSDVDELPKWMQERLAILMVSRLAESDFGRRLDENTFWVKHP